MLFLHKQVEFVQTVKSCSVFGKVEFERFKKANHGYAAFVMDGIAHVFSIRLQRYELFTIAM
jgi:hypothetical protein